MYSYQATIYKTEEVIISGGTDDTDRSDFETNFKATAVEINDIEYADTVFIVQKTYTQFKALIVSPLVWSDVKYENAHSRYILSILSETAL